MKRLFAYIFLVIGVIAAYADKWIKDAEPAILEVHYTRTEVYDTTKRSSHFTKDPVMLRIGKDKSVFCGVKRLWKDSITAVDPATFWEIDRARVMSDKRDDTAVIRSLLELYLQEYPRRESDRTGVFRFGTLAIYRRLGKT